MGSVKLACQNGDKIVHTFYAINEGTSPCYDVVGEFVIPDGLTLNYRTSLTSEGGVTPIIDAGVFNFTQKKWIIGTLGGGKRYTIVAEFEVTDEGAFGVNDFVVEFNITSSCVENEDDNSAYLSIEKYCPSEPSVECDDLNITLI